jgi:hypothetical protein
LIPMYSACSASLLGYNSRFIVNTMCWAIKSEGGTGDTQIKSILARRRWRRAELTTCLLLHQDAGARGFESLLGRRRPVPVAQLVEPCEDRE